MDTSVPRAAGVPFPEVVGHHHGLWLWHHHRSCVGRHHGLWLWLWPHRLWPWHRHRSCVGHCHELWLWPHHRSCVEHPYGLWLWHYHRSCVGHHHGLWPWHHHRSWLRQWRAMVDKGRGLLYNPQNKGCCGTPCAELLLWFSWITSIHGRGQAGGTGQPRMAVVQLEFPALLAVCDNPLPLKPRLGQ